MALLHLANRSLFAVFLMISLLSLVFHFLRVVRVRAYGRVTSAKSAGVAHRIVFSLPQGGEKWLAFKICVNPWLSQPAWKYNLCQLAFWFQISSRINGTAAKHSFSFCTEQSSSSFLDLGKLSPSRHLKETWENLANTWERMRLWEPAGSRMSQIQELRQLCWTWQWDISIRVTSEVISLI